MLHTLGCWFRGLDNCLQVFIQAGLLCFATNWFLPDPLAFADTHRWGLMEAFSTVRFFGKQDRKEQEGPAMGDARTRITHDAWQISLSRFLQNYLGKSALKVHVFVRFRPQTGHQKQTDCCQRVSRRLSTLCECRNPRGGWESGHVELPFVPRFRWANNCEWECFSECCLPAIGASVRPINSTPRGWFGTGLQPIWWNRCCKCILEMRKTLVKKFFGCCHAKSYVFICLCCHGLAFAPSKKLAFACCIGRFSAIHLWFQSTLNRWVICLAK